jgi:hypothetical protein
MENGKKNLTKKTDRIRYTSVAVSFDAGRYYSLRLVMYDV